MLIDVSGSMQPYADSLLRLAHRIVRAVPHHVEVFTIGTRLTRITRRFGRARLKRRWLQLGGWCPTGREVPGWVR
jgi:uncharacterized protein with von Willebrand factor type A (vWA) domain